jgi:hypothetical protein
VHLLAIDEAHCISKWGHDLRPAYQRWASSSSMLGSPRTIALTATATAAVRADIREVLGDDEDSMPLFATGIERPNLAMSVEPVWDDREKVERIAEINTKMGGTGIVYFALIKDLERMVDDVRRAVPGAEVDIYHGRWTRSRRSASTAGSSRRGPTSRWSCARRTRSVWAWTSRISAASCTPRCRAAWRRTTRRSGAPDATATRRSACCCTTRTIWRSSTSSRGG